MNHPAPGHWASAAHRPSAWVLVAVNLGLLVVLVVLKTVVDLGLHLRERKVLG